MLGLFRPLEEYIGPAMLTVGVLHFIVFLGCILKIFFGIRLFSIRRT
jgi:hypothetical protein